MHAFTCHAHVYVHIHIVVVVGACLRPSLGQHRSGAVCVPPRCCNLGRFGVAAQLWACGPSVTSNDALGPAHPGQEVHHRELPAWTTAASRVQNLLPLLAQGQQSVVTNFVSNDHF